MSATANQPAPLTEKAALAELAAWAEKRPAWQKDALRRLVTGQTFDDQVIAELSACAAVSPVSCDTRRSSLPLNDNHIPPYEFLADGH